MILLEVEVERCVVQQVVCGRWPWHMRSRDNINLKLKVLGALEVF